MKTIALFEYIRKHYLPQWIILAVDLIIVIVSFVFAYLFDNNFILEFVNSQLLLWQLMVVLGVFSFCFSVFRPFASILRKSTINDAAIVLKSTSVGFLIILVISQVTSFYQVLSIYHFPISVLLFLYTLSSAIMIAVRIIVKALYDYIYYHGKGGYRVLIFGAGKTGFVTLKVLLNDHHKKYIIVGLVDDNKQLHGKMIDGIAVMPTHKLTADYVRRHHVQSLIFAVDDDRISRNRKEKLFDQALSAGLEILKVPSSDRWINNQLNIRQLKKINVEDLLGRDPIRLNFNIIEATLRGKVILVTGAAGSIGSEIVRQLLRCDVKQIILLDQAETPLYDIQNELRHSQGNTDIKVVIANVASFVCMKRIFENYSPQIVFNAAAYKHVPLMEDHPKEALRVNVGGTRNTADLAVQFGVEKYIMISTDKAVNPTNVMGASKRICEMYIQSLSCREDVNTQFITTRFGNVLGSNGSVVPLFERQIEKGGPITLTHKEITRYFMTIPEACQLVLEAGSMGRGGEIYVFDMGQPVRIYDLAVQMIRLSGMVLDEDIKIKITGLRPGEKLYEELLATKENTLPTHHEKIMIAKVRKVDFDVVAPLISQMLENIYENSMMEIVSSMKKLVPEYKSHNSVYCKLDDDEKQLETENQESSQDSSPILKKRRVLNDYPSQENVQGKSEPVFRDMQPRLNIVNEDLEESVMISLMKNGKKAFKNITSFLFNGL